MDSSDIEKDQGNVEFYFHPIFIDIDDPRIRKKCFHTLFDILFLSFCAIICGAEGYVDIQRFGESKELWLRKYIDLLGGIPSHDTIRRTFSILDPEQLEKAFLDFMFLLQGLTEKTKHLCIDGKSVKGTERGFNYEGRRPLHLVNVYCPDSGLVLAQRKAGSAGASEIKPMEFILDLIDINGLLLTFDAASSYPVLLKKIRQKKAHYLVPIKGNQKLLHAALEKYFKKIPLNGKSKHVRDYIKQSEKNRGRLEERTATVVLPNQLDTKTMGALRHHEPDSKSVIRVTRYRKEKDLRTYPNSTTIKNKNYMKLVNRKGKKAIIYYISDLKLDGKRALELIRQHWSIENKLHWNLDISFKEDDWRVKDQQAARNLSLFRKLAFNLLTKNDSKIPLRAKIKKAAWDEKYLEKIIFDVKA